MSDNFFSLLPGEGREVGIEGAASGAFVKACAWNAPAVTNVVLAGRGDVEGAVQQRGRDIPVACVKARVWQSTFPASLPTIDIHAREMI